MQRETLRDTIVSKNQPGQVAFYSGCCWKSSGKRSALAQLRRILSLIVENPENMNCEHVIKDDIFWKLTIEIFKETLGSQNLSEIALNKKLKISLILAVRIVESLSLIWYMYSHRDRFAIFKIFLETKSIQPGTWWYHLPFAKNSGLLVIFMALERSNLRSSFPCLFDRFWASFKNHVGVSILSSVFRKLENALPNLSIPYSGK